MPAGRRFDENEQKAYLALLRSGEGRLSAARRLGWSGQTINAARKANIEFDAAVTEALDEAAEPVESVLYEAAKRGEPWAVQMWLKGRLGHRGWSDKVEVEHTGTVEIEAGHRLEGIAKLQAALLDRQRAVSGEVMIEAHVVESQRVGEHGRGASKELARPSVPDVLTSVVQPLTIASTRGVAVGVQSQKEAGEIQASPAPSVVDPPF